MADDTAAAGQDQAARGLTRAFAAPVRAMSRILGGAGGAGSAQSPAPDDGVSAIVDCALYVDGVRQSGEWSYPQALAHAQQAGNGFVWLGLKEPSITELTRIADVFTLHELWVEDAAKSGQRPKVERYGDVTFMTLRTARYVEHAQLTETSEVVESGEVMMFVGDRFIISVRHGDACRLAPVRADLETKKELLSQGPWAVAYAVCDLIVDVAIEVSAAIEEDVAELEESVFSRAQRSGIQHIYQLKRELMEFKRAVLPLQRPLASLSSAQSTAGQSTAGQSAGVPAEIQRYFQDVSDHLTRTVEQVLYLDDLLNSILQARLAQVSVDQNNDMRKIAAWAGIAAVWTTIGGIWGMNFKYMPELQWPLMYPMVLSLGIVGSVLLYRAFRRSGWL